MNRPLQIPDRETEEQASLWAARLEGSHLSDSDRGELDAWLGQDPARRSLLSRYCGFSATLDVLVPELAASGSKATRLEAPRRRALGPWKLAAAGLVAAALAVCVVRLVWTGGHPETITAPVGQRQSFTLADGTRVDLNANTSIVVENGRAERRVHLANGEAFFVVTKDKTRPFIVDTPAGSVRVTGTIFNVRTEAASELDVTVVEGSVKVSPDDPSGVPLPQPYTLGAGDRLSTEGGPVSLQALSSGDLEDSLAWRQGQIVCKGMLLSEVLSRFAHYHGRVITVTPEAGRKSVGGRRNLEDIDGFLADIGRQSGVRVVRGADGAVRVSLLTEP